MMTTALLLLLRSTTQGMHPTLSVTTTEQHEVYSPQTLTTMTTTRTLTAISNCPLGTRHASRVQVPELWVFPQPTLDGFGQLHSTYKHHAGTVLLCGQQSQVYKKKAHEEGKLYAIGDGLQMTFFLLDSL